MGKPQVVTREVEGNRDVPQPFAALRLGDDGSLVADDGVVDPSFERVPPHRLEHPHHADP